MIEGLWVVTDSQILLLVTQHTGFVELLSFFSIFILPIPLLGFIRVILPSKTKMLSVIRTLFVLTLVLLYGQLHWRVAADNRHIDL